MSKERADYIIDKTLAIADFDNRRGMTLQLRGKRDALINQLCEVLGLWDMPMTREEAARLVDKAIARRSRPWFWLGAAIGAALFIIVLASYASASPCGCHHRHHYYYQEGYNRQDIYRGPPENGGYRGGHYGGRYHDNTKYFD
jgi:hypothetical protein